LLGRALGGFVGDKIGGSTGRTIGNLAGGFGGGFLPFSAGPTQGQAQPSSLGMNFVQPSGWQNLQNFMRRYPRPITPNLGLFDTGPGQGQTQGQAQPSDLEMQNFWSVFQKIAQGVGKGVDIGRGLGLFNTGPGQGQQAGGSTTSPEQLAALLQQALPALQAFVALQQQPTTGRPN
jgi:hypothetical protein